MKKARNWFIKNVHYLCLIGVVALGLMTIIGTGGGGGGGSDTSTPTTDAGETGGGGGGSTDDSPSIDVEIEIFYEEIPGSKYHSPNATFWGDNMSKIVRYGNRVFMGVMDNENVADGPPNATNPSKFCIYKKEGDNQWEKGAELNAFVPGNLLIDSIGVLHAIVFEPTYTTDSGHWGKLIHYWFSNSNAGNIIDYEQEIIIDNDGITDGETVNPRVGAAIGYNDTLAIGFGLYTSDKGHTEQLYFKGKNDATWTKHVADQDLGHNFYYPYVLVNNDDGFHILAIQDDFKDDYSGPYPYIYQIIQYFEFKDSSWISEIIADFTDHDLAPTRLQLLEHSDIFQDSTGKIHLIWASRTDPDNPWKAFFTHEIQQDNGSWNSYSISFSDENISWIRIIELDGELYYFCVTWDRLYLQKGDTGQLVELDINGSSGYYLYISAPRGGTREIESVIDILLLNGGSGNYPDAKNYYLRISKSELTKLE